VLLTLMIAGLTACSQSDVREPSVQAHSQHALSRDRAPNADADRELPPTGADRRTVEDHDAVASTGFSTNGSSDRDRTGGIMYASNNSHSAGRDSWMAAEPGSGQLHGGLRQAQARESSGGTLLGEDRDLGAEPSYPGIWSGDAEKPLRLAAASDEAKTEDAEKTAQCAAFEKDIDADLGEVLGAGCQPTLAQMSALMDNPLGNVAMLFTQVDLYRLNSPVTGKEANKWNYMGIAQFPKALTEDWNLINRIIWNVPSMPLDQGKIDKATDRARRAFGSGQGGAVLPPTSAGAAPIDLFDGRTTGFGDMYYNGLVSPKKPIALEGGAKFLWGAGLDMGFPTATEDILGTGKWLVGPSALGVYMGPKWKVGGLAQQFWDFAGDSDRDGVNMTNLQVFYYYSLNATTSIGAAPNIIANWEQDSDNTFTVPIGLGINKTFQFGKVPVRIGAECHYSVITPDDVVGSDWDLRFYIIPAAPSALFKWMTKPMFSGG
jgi:hypothetical protein